jgi:hypothetical protein
MIKHILMWTFKERAEGRSKDENIAMAVEILSGLRDKVPTVRFLEVGRNITRSDGAFDLAFYSGFDDETGLEVYRKHPEHLKAVKFLGKVRDQRAVVDYEA